MAQERADIALARLARRQFGTFSREQALELGLTTKQVDHRVATKRWARVLPGVYRHAGTPPTETLVSTAALLWAGATAVIAGVPAAREWGITDLVPGRADIAVPRGERIRGNQLVRVRHTDNVASLQAQRRNGLPVTSVAATLLMLAAEVGTATLEDAFESARRQRLVTTSSTRRYLDVHARQGVRGAKALRTLVDAVDPHAPSRSKLEVLTRQLLEAHGLSGFVREYPMSWNGRRYLFDFAFPAQRVILETNGRRWHDDPSDYERDNEKWSVPGRLGWRIVFATWDKVLRSPEELLAELRAALAA
ncbi:MAG TPA: type IV toxin-antitoxin system AbiEi family antitoxin domain-containing protein [Acidimicrobiia bacterium]|jgi:very-short-patch-repair endonuclease